MNMHEVVRMLTFGTVHCLDACRPFRPLVGLSGLELGGGPPSGLHWLRPPALVA